MNYSSPDDRLSAVVAVATNGTIGRANTLPWRLKSDLQRFKRLTMGHALIMGRKTYESIGRPLPGRQTIVLTKTANLSIPNVEVAHSLEQALRIVHPAKQAFVVGGAEIYRLAKPIVKHLYITRVLADIEGDATLDEWNLEEFDCLEEVFVPADSDNQYPTLNQHFVRKNLAS